MNYYRRWIGDYVKKTAHLSLAEHGAYNVLLDVCYSTEKPLPASVDALCRLCRAMTREEQAAVASVAEQFFPVGEDGLRHNPRADEELGIAQATIEKQRKSGAESASKRWSTDKLTDGSTHSGADNSTDGLTDRYTDAAIHGSAIQPSTSNLQPPASTPQPSTTNHQGKAAARAPDPGDSGRIAARLRDLGVSVTAQHPVCVQWAADSVELEKLEQAVAVVRARKPDGQIAARYLDTVVRDESNFRPKAGSGLDDVFSRSMANTADWKPPEEVS